MIFANIRGVIAKHFAKMLWPLLLAFLAGLFAPSDGYALLVRLQTRPDIDVLSFIFESGQIPEYSVSRTGKQTVTLSLPGGAWASERRPESKPLTGSRLAASVSATDNGVTISMKSNAFGYITVPVSGQPELQIHIFRDPIGAKWGDRSKPAPAKKPEPPAQVAETPKPTPEPVPAAKPAPKPETTPAVKPEPTPEAKPVAAETELAPAPTAQPAADKTPAVDGEKDIPAEGPQTLAQKPVLPAESGTPGIQRSFFSVPYSMRAEVLKVGPDQAVIMEPGDPSSSDKDESELRFVAVRKGPEEVDFAQIVTRELESAVQETQPGPAAVDNATPEREQTQAVAEAPQPQEVQTETQPEATPETRQPEASPEAPQEDQQQAQQPAAQIEDAGEEAADQAEPAVQEQEGADGQVAEEGAEKTLTEREQYLDDLKYAAQSAMAAGDLRGASVKFEELLKQPDTGEPLREEALYTLGDIYSQLYKDSLVDHFEEIKSKYEEAMNSNLKSSRVPQALLNLGLLNLKVGNIPEAQAYFNILADRYPDDDNIPFIGYYWGEYYFNKGDFEKASDKFQELVQTYPDSRIVKNAAFLLAQALNELQYDDQAFQIVDYIDKRWPLYYLENPEFLKLAADVERRLEKIAEAKDHYWTYYNINPESESADVVLARIGDIYLTQGKNAAAKEIYQKAIKEFPDREGGLVAKMRLAEEAIYDKPTMTEMVSVFDRPYNMRPKEIYTEIIENYPESPVAPLALLKLAMWYSFHDKYAEALAAAQDFLDRYPDSELADRAREVGDKSFTLAVPQLVADGNYGRVVRYWEDYRFVDEAQSSITDEVKLDVALSYWKTGNPAKALELVQPYLGKNQIERYSEEALSLAVNIYLEQLAWNNISQLVGMARTNWTITPRLDRQLEFARAMSLESLGDSGKALPIWAKLAGDVNFETGPRAYAMYYMAKAGMEKQDLRRVFLYSQEALSLLLESDGDPQKIKDCILMSIYATERSGRYSEALKWAREYGKYVPEEDPEWSSARYKLAQIYRMNGDVAQWREIMNDIKDKKPDSLYGRLAASAVETYNIEQRAMEYAPVPN